MDEAAPVKACFAGRTRSLGQEPHPTPGCVGPVRRSAPRACREGYGGRAVLRFALPVSRRWLSDVQSGPLCLSGLLGRRDSTGHARAVECGEEGQPGSPSRTGRSPGAVGDVCGWAGPFPRCEATGGQRADGQAVSGMGRRGQRARRGLPPARGVPCAPPGAPRLRPPRLSSPAGFAERWLRPTVLLQELANGPPLLRVSQHTWLCHLSQSASQGEAQWQTAGQEL